jgi:type I restriction enzyme S subunit
MSRLIKDIPSDWKAIRFDKVFDFLPTLTLSRNDLTSDESFEGIYNIHYGDIHSTYRFVKLDFDKEKSIPKITKEGIDETRLTLLNSGDIVIADASEDYEGVAACIELSNVQDRKVTAGLHTFAARDKKGITSDGFRSYLLKHPWVSNELKKMVTGSKVYGVSKTNIAKLEVVLPPLLEQQKIAAILSKWDELIETQTHLINTKEKQKTSLMQKLLTGEVRFPGFEEEWEEYTLGEHLTFQNGYAFKSNLFNDKNKGLRLVKNRDLKNDNLVIFTTETFKPEYLIENGDLLVGMDGDFSPCIWKKGESLLNQRVGRLKNFSDKVNKEFLYYFLTDILAKIQNDTGSTTVKHLSGTNITELNILIPNQKEQEKIANALMACDEELQSLKDELEAIQLQKKGLMQQLLTGKIRVKA